MKRKVIIAVLVIAALAFVVIRLANNKSKINKEVAYKEVIENVPVNVLKAETTRQNSEISIVGLFKASKEAPVSAESAGKIVSVTVNEGDLVTEGQVIAELDQTILFLKLDADEAQYTHSKEDLERYENLNKSNATTDVTLKQMRLANSLNELAVKNTKEQIAKSKIRASISGYLTSKNFEKGTVVSPGAPIGQITNISTLKFTAMVPEYQVIKFELAQKVAVSADVFPDSKFTGTISQIGEKGDENHNYKIEATVNNDKRQNLLKAGMNGTMKVSDKNISSGIFVPREVIVGTTEKPQVFIAEGDKAVLKDVKIGATIGNTVQILTGITDGAAIIVSGMNNLKDGRTIKIN
jgi:membrane fusion protein (multidrug efflux system)